MGINLSLESFDRQVDTPAESCARTYDEGYAEGQAAAKQSFEEEQTNFKEELIQILNDSAFGYQEAQAHFQSGMQIYLRSVFERVLPELRAPALHAELIAILNDGVKRAAEDQITLQVSSDQFGPVSALVAQMDFPHVQVSQSEDLKTHAAFISSPSREIALDVDAAVDAIAKHSAILLQPIEEVS